MMYTDETFESVNIVLDGTRFERCRFVRCRLHYTADHPAGFVDCSFDQCEWIFEDAADFMLAFLASLYRNTDAEGKSLVESIFQGIRDGAVGANLAAPRTVLTA